MRPSAFVAIFSGCTRAHGQRQVWHVCHSRSIAAGALASRVVGGAVGYGRSWHCMPPLATPHNRLASPAGAPRVCPGSPPPPAVVRLLISLPVVSLASRRDTVDGAPPVLRGRRTVCTADSRAPAICRRLCVVSRLRSLFWESTTVNFRAGAGAGAAQSRVVDLSARGAAMRIDAYHIPLSHCRPGERRRPAASARAGRAKPGARVRVLGRTNKERGYD